MGPSGATATIQAKGDVTKNWGRGGGSRGRPNARQPGHAG